MRSSAGLAAVLILAGVPFSVGANAQSQPTPAPTESAQPKPSANIPDSKLDATAAAVKNVSTVKEQYQKKIADAPEADKARLAREGTDALAKAVTDQGLSVAEYTAILKLAENDTGVRDKILQRLR